MKGKESYLYVVASINYIITAQQLYTACKDLGC